MDKTAIIRIEDLKLKTIIGVNPIERKRKQPIIINISMEYNAGRAVQSDNLKHALDYKALKWKIIRAVEKSKFNLLETLADNILKIVKQEPKVIRARVKVGKPGALRYARTVSVEMGTQRTQR